MALTEPFTGFFTDEWERFRAGVERLNPGSFPALMDQYERARIPAGQRNIVSIPGWTDAVHLYPRYQPTTAERQEYWAARREGRDANLPGDVVAELNRRADLVRRIRAAPDAEVAGSWGRILTAIDNVQDFLSTMSLLGRLAVWAAPRVLGRLIPGVNVIIALGDLLNLLNLIGLTAIPIWALLCRGPRGAFAAGLPLLVFKKALKLHVWNRALRSPFGRLAQLRAPLGALSRRALVGRLAEAAQTSDALFGVGISFGAIVGLVTGGAAAAALSAQGEPVRIEGPGFRPQPAPRRQPSGPPPGTGAYEVSRQLRQLINRPLVEDPRADLHLLALAAAVMRDAPALLARPQLFTTDELAGFLTALVEAQRVLYTRLRPYAWLDVVAAGADVEWTAPVAPSETTAQAAAELFPGEEISDGWDVAGNPRQLPAGDYARRLGALIGPALGARLTLDRHGELALYLGTLLNQGAEEAWHAILGDADGLRWELAPDWALLANIVEEGRLVVPPDDEQALHAFWQAALAARRRVAPAPLGVDALDALAARYGVTLARQLPPGSAWPEPWQRFLEAQLGNARAF